MCEVGADQVESYAIAYLEAEKGSRFETSCCAVPQHALNDKGYRN